MDSTVSSIPTVSYQKETVGKKTMDRNDFMTLFITQLQYQDPMEPMDSYEMGSQMAQFSTVDATMKVSEDMEKLLDYQTSQNNIQLLSLLGKEARSAGNAIGVTDGSASVTEFTVTEPSDSCVVKIFNGKHELIRTIDMGKVMASTYELAWDGKDAQGKAVPNGAYTYSVKANNSTGQEIKVAPMTSGRVTGVEFSSGQAMLTLNNYLSVKVSDVVSVRQEGT